MTERIDPHGEPPTRTLAAASAPDSMRLLSIPEAARALNVPETWLRKKVSAREVPFTRLGRHVRFTSEHLRRIITNGEELETGAPARQGLSRRARRAIA